MSVGCNERGRGYRDADVDFYGYHSCNPRSAGLWYRVADQIRFHAERKQCMYFYLPADLMDTGSVYYSSLLPRRTVEEKSNSRIERTDNRRRA